METVIDCIVLAHCASTWAMVGLIWFVQLVHYPLFDWVGEHSFAAYERQHQRRTTWIVAPLMFVELATAGALLCWRPGFVPAWLVGFGAALLAGIWLSTAFIQVPLHAQLAARFSADASRRLVLSNWIRTCGWTLRGVVALALTKSI